MRSEFEKLPEISEILDRNGGGYYRELTKDYHHNYPYFEKFLNGAWFIYQHQQSKVDELTLQVAEMKSRLNDAYTDGQSSMYKSRQSKVDELQRRNRILNENIKEQGQKLVYQNEVIETQAEKLLGLRDEKAELQKRLDAALEVVKQGIRKQGVGKQCGDYYLEKVEKLLEGGGC